MKALLFRLMIEPRRHQDTKIQKLSQKALMSWGPRGEQLVATTTIPGTKISPTPSGSTCAARSIGQLAANCVDHEIDLLDLADALLRNAPQAYLQQAYASTLAHIHHCPTCRVTLVDLVLTTLHYDAHLPLPAVLNPTEEGIHHVT